MTDFDNDFGGRFAEVRKLREMRQFDRALSMLSALMEQFPKSFELFETRSEIYRELGNMDSAYADLHRVMDLVPNEVAPYFRRARWRMETKDYNNAIEDLTKVIDASDGYFRESAYFLRAVSYVRTKQFAAAWYDCKHVQDGFSLGSHFGSKAEIVGEISRSIDIRDLS